MATLLQVALLLILIALVGIILGYFLGKISCKREDSGTYINKNGICEDELRENLVSARESSESENIIADENNLESATATSAVALVSTDSESSNSDKDSSNSSINTTESTNENSSNSEYNNSNSLTEENKIESAKSLQDSEKSEDNSAAKAQLTESESSASSNESSEVNDNTNKKEDNNLSDDSKETTKDSNSNLKIDEDSNKNIQETKDTEAVSENDKPVALKEPKDGKADNLCRIKGIGVVIEGKLNSLGIFHFDQIASWTEKEIEWVDKHLSFSGRIIREDWIGQAKLLAAGEETEFSKRVDKGEVESSPNK